MLAGLAVFAGITNSYRSHETDPLLINDIIQTVKENIDHIDSLEDENLGTQLKVFDSSGFMIYSTGGNEIEDVNSVEQSIYKGYICLAINDGGRFLGTVVIPDPDKSEYDMARKKLLFAAAVFISVLMLAVALYGIYVSRTIIKPFRKMEVFAEKVAQGELDSPVFLEKTNMFGSFTESFDIMREELKAARDREDALKIKEKETTYHEKSICSVAVTGTRCGACGR